MRSNYSQGTQSCRTPGGSKIVYRDIPERLTHHVEFALEVLPTDIDEVAKALSQASTALLGTWYRIAKELGRSHPDEHDPRRSLRLEDLTDGRS